MPTFVGLELHLSDWTGMEFDGPTEELGMDERVNWMEPRRDVNSDVSSRRVKVESTREGENPTPLP